MNPSFRAFTEELILIKQAERVSKPVEKGMFKQVLKNALISGAATGSAYATARLAKPLIRKVVSTASPGARKALLYGMTGLGGLGGLLFATGMAQGRRLEDEAARNAKSKHDS